MQAGEVDWRFPGDSVELVAEGPDGEYSEEKGERDDLCLSSELSMRACRGDNHTI